MNKIHGQPISNRINLLSFNVYINFVFFLYSGLQQSRLFCEISEEAVYELQIL